MVLTARSSGRLLAVMAPVGVSASLLLGPGNPVLAQDGVLVNLGISQRLESNSSDGPDTDSTRDEGLQSITRLNIGLQSQTRAQTLSLQTGTGLVYNFDTNDFDTQDPLLRLDYALQNRTSQLSFNALYRRARINDTVFFDDELDEDIITGGGTRENLTLGTGLVLGRGTPTTFSLSYSYRETSYSGTTDPNLSDQTRNSVDAQLSLVISPVLTTRISASWQDIDEQGIDAIDTTRLSYGVSATYVASPVLQLSFGLSFDDIDSDDGRESGGLGFNVAAQHARPNGSLGVSLSSQETLNGSRQQVLVTRSLALRRGALSGGIGVTRTGSLDPAPLANLRLEYALTPDSTLDVSLSQSSRTSSNNEETISTRLNASYAKTLTSISSLSVGFQLARQDALSDGGIDQSSARLNLTYRRQLTQDWGLVSGTSFSRIQRDGEADTSANQVFVGIERNFSFRP